jgi:hypothetical protein
MALPLTQRTREKLEEGDIQPRYVFCIDGIVDCFTAVLVKKTPRFDDGLFFDEDVIFDDLVIIEEQKPFISFDGTTKSIKQQLKPDQGSVSSISSITVRLIDKDQFVSKIISPGVKLTDILGQDAELYILFEDTAFPEDAVKILRGPVVDIVSGAGWIELTVNAPNEKARQRLFESLETKLDGAIDNVTTTIVLDRTDDLIIPADTVRSFVRIGNEFIEYTGVSGNTLTGVTRGALSGIDARAGAAAHDDDSEARSFYILEDGAIEMALKMMLSDGANDDFVSGVEISNIGTTDEGTVANSLYIQGVNIAREYGIVPGDFVTVTGAANGGNNVSGEEIIQIVETADGSYIVVDSPLVLEADTAATMSFKSQYAVWPEGLGMTPREVDVAEHEFILETFLATFNYRFYISDTIEEAKTFIERQIYTPAAMYSLPRGTRSSVGLHVAPFPFADIQVIDETNVKNPDKIKLRRAFKKNFYNNIVYKFDKNLIDDQFDAGTINVNAQSIEELGRRKDFTIEAEGMRSDLQAVSLAATAGGRLLDRYNRGAEYIENLELFFGDGLSLEPGDSVIFDAESLQITNTLDGTRVKPQKYFEVQNKSIDLNGRATVNITDTSFDGSNRYALFSPASLVKSGSVNSILIKPSYSQPFGQNEWRKWQDFLLAKIQIRNADYTNVAVTGIASISGNTITFTDPLPFTPQEDYVMEFAPYDQQTSERVKLIYTHNSDGENDFGDGQAPYRYL